MIFGVDSLDGLLGVSTWIAVTVGSVILLSLFRVVTMPAEEDTKLLKLPVSAARAMVAEPC